MGCVGHWCNKYNGGGCDSSIGILGPVEQWCCPGHCIVVCSIGYGAYIFCVSSPLVPEFLYTTIRLDCKMVLAVCQKMRAQEWVGSIRQLGGIQDGSGIGYPWEICHCCCL